MTQFDRELHLTFLSKILDFFTHILKTSFLKVSSPRLLKFHQYYYPYCSRKILLSLTTYNRKSEPAEQLNGIRGETLIIFHSFCHREVTDKYLH